MKPYESKSAGFDIFNWYVVWMELRRLPSVGYEFGGKVIIDKPVGNYFQLQWSIGVWVITIEVVNYNQ